MNTVKTVKKIFDCVECKNSNDLSASTYGIGDIHECPFCGIEFEKYCKDYD